MTTLHIVTSYYPPQAGGLQRWTADLAAVLHEAGLRPVVYVCEPPAVAARHPDAPFEIVDIAPLAETWTAPLLGSRVDPQALARDRSRVTFACLRSQIARRSSAASDLILSNFVTTAGFTAHLVAEDLALRHVAVVPGTDFTRGLRNPQERYVFKEVCGAAHLVIAKSEEQRLGIGRAVPGARIEVVGTPGDVVEERWRRPPSEALRIFSDCGFSFKKGTGVLIDSCLALPREGLDVRLEISGSDAPAETAYWTERRRAAAEAPGLDTCFPGHLPSADLLGRLRGADLYASATLGEGSSTARARALCFGIPMVTTACGELFGDPGADHVRLVPVADAPAFARALRRLALEVRDGSVRIDEDSVARYRARFDRAAGWSRWIEILRREAGHG
jgi:glycosyltransferase involved in cell wall biosynthesis